MRESRADTVQATLLAIALHALLFALAWLGMWWTRTTAPPAAAGPVIQAELIDPDALSASMRQVLSERPEPLPAPEPVPEPTPAPPPEPEPVETAPPPQPLPEPRPQEAPTPPQPQPQERIPEPDTREQARVSKQALAEQQAREKREQEERRRQEQIELAAEQQRQAEAERRERLSEMERQRREQLADIRRQQEAAAREEEEAERKLAKIRAAQEADAASAASASPPPGNEGVDRGLLAKYQAALQAAIEREWNRPETVRPGQVCRIVIKQIVGGEVLSANVDPSCPYDALGRRSIEAAVRKAAPLPYAGFESVFNRTLLLDFQAPAN